MSPTVGVDAAIAALHAGFAIGCFVGAAALYLFAIGLRWWRERA